MNADQKTRPQHTPEPISHTGTNFNTAGQAVFFLYDEKGCELARFSADRARIAACVNACAGLNPEAIPALVEAAQGMSATLTTMNRHRKPEQIWTLLDDWNVRLYAALAAVEVKSHAPGCRCPECDPDWNSPEQIARDEASE